MNFAGINKLVILFGDTMDDTYLTTDFVTLNSTHVTIIAGLFFAGFKISQQTLNQSYKKAN